LDLHYIFVLQWPYVYFAWEASMRSDETTRECNNFGERVGAVASNQTEPIGASAPNKQSKLVAAGIVTRQTKRGTREEDCKKGTYQFLFVVDAVPSGAV
jgi:hypothetical protein